MSQQTAPWPPPGGAPEGTSGWYLASDLQWYQSDEPPADGYLLIDGRWHDGESVNEPWRSSRWGLGDVWWCLLAYVGAGVVGTVIVAIVAAIRGTDTLDESTTPWAIAAFVACNAIATGGVVLIATRRKGLKSLRRDFGLECRWMDVLIGLGLGIAGVVAAGLVSWGIDSALGADERSSNVPVDELVGPGDFVMFFLAVAIVTPFIEEVVFRGLLYRSLLKRGRSAPIAIAITTLVFVLPHLPAAENWVEFASLIGSISMLGLAFNLAAHWTGNRLGAAIVAHALVNGLATIALATM